MQNRTDAIRRMTRFLRPSLIGRALSACVSETDRREAWLVGQKAVQHLMEGQSGYMVTLERRSDEPYQCETGLAELLDEGATRVE